MLPNTCGDANWRDKLTAVNGSTIRYDAIGNPLSDGTWTYTWQNGRQLQKMQKAGVTAEFVYNADGLRVQKMVNGVATKYTLHGKNIVHMTSGADELHFFYDAQNRPEVVVYNGVPYAYVKSLQGDVIALLDGTGNVVVSYVYDAWGAPIGKSGSMAETLGTVQPFRYRGYVFDEETGLYYLRSRYYNPGWGRFVNADALIDQNLYSYCKNSPIQFHDPSGYREELDDPFMEVFDSMTDKVEKPTIYTKVKFSRKLCREYIIRNSGLKIQEYKHSAPPITRIFTIGPNFAEGTSLVLSGIDSAGIIIDVIRTQEIAYAEDCAILGRTYTDAAFMFDEYNYVIVEAIYNDTLGEMKFSFYDEQDNLMGVSAVASFSSVRAPGDFFYDLVLTAQQQRIPYGLEGRDRDFSLRYN